MLSDPAQPAGALTRPKCGAPFAVGDKAFLFREIREEDAQTFATLSGDDNPIHLDPGFAGKHVFRRKIAHGMMVASQMSALLGTRIPGPGSLYLKQEIEFVRPVFFGDVIRAEVEVVTSHSRGVYELTTRCVNQDGELVLDGKAVVKMLRS